MTPKLLTPHRATLRGAILWTPGWLFLTSDSYSYFSTNFFLILPPDWFDTKFNQLIKWVPHMNMNEFDMVIFLSLLVPPETPSLAYRKNSNGPPLPASNSPFNFPPPSSSSGLNFNIYYGKKLNIHHTNIDSFSEHNNTIQDSLNNNSFVDCIGLGKHSGVSYSMISLS